MHRLAAVGLAIFTTLSSIPFAAAEEQSETRTFALHQMVSPDAATVLSTIAGIRQLNVQHDHNLQATGGPAALRIATELLSALDAPEIAPSQSFTTGDDTVIAVIPLSGISPSDAMLALRELKLQRVAALDRRSVVVVRDTPEQVTRALATLEKSVP